MFVYLDESGDTGFRFRHGSTRYFVMTLLLVEDPIPIHAAIDDLRRRLGFGPYDEFKFNHSATTVRGAFLLELRKHDFWARSVVIDKTLLSHRAMPKQETFYNFLVRTILANDGGSIRDATLVLDESIKSRKRQDQLASSLRKALNADPRAPKVRAVVHHESHRDNLLQATDMVCGAVYARYHRREIAYFDLVAAKFKPPHGDLWEWQPPLAH